MAKGPPPVIPPGVPNGVNSNGGNWKTFCHLFSPVTGLAHANPIFALISWNCRALFCRDVAKRRAKLNYLLALSRDASVICLQETHGNENSLNKYLGILRTRFWVHHSLLPQAAGGVMILVSKKYATTFSSCPHEVFAPGRISKIQVLGEHSQMRVWNVHNFDISSSELVNFVQALQLDLTWAEGDPLTRSVFLAGDLNFQAAHEVRLPYAAPLNASSPTQGVGVRTLPTCPRILDFQRQTTPLLNQLIEITQPLPTHYQSHGSTGSKIDRVFTSNPPWTFPHSTFTFGVVDDPMDLHLKGISDHGALRLTVGKRRSCPKSAQTIAGEIFKHPKFAEFHKRLVEDTRLECLREYDRLLVHKQIIRSAAKQTREYIQDNEPGNNLMLCQNFTTCARAIWSNDVPLARRLIRNTCIGKTFLKIDGIRSCS